METLGQPHHFMKRGVRAHKISLTPPLSIEVLHLARKVNDHVYVNGIDFASVTLVFRLNFGTVMTMWYPLYTPLPPFYCSMICHFSNYLF
jgi:hypothetical protein